MSEDKTARIRELNDAFRKERSIMPEFLKGDALAGLIKGLVAGAVAVLVLGFSLGYLVLGSTAESMASKRVEKMLLQVYVPVCVDRYTRNATAAQRKAFADKSKWGRDDVIEDTVFATPPGFEAPHSGIADDCAEALTKLLEKASKG